MKIDVRLAQMKVDKDIDNNASKIISILQSSSENEWVIFPEGALSWYTPDVPNFVQKLEFEKIDQKISEIKELTITKGIHVLLGTMVSREGKIFNSAYYLDYHSNFFTYDKYNLGVNDRSNFVAGSSLDVFEVDGVKFGIQICRDNTFPEPWRLLKKQGAHVIFHLNNAIRESDSIRRNVLITRAFENQFFVCSANNAHEPQTLPSLAISPQGEVIAETEPCEETTVCVKLNLDECKDFYANETRLQVC